MRTWTEIQHHQPARPYLGLPHGVVATGMVGAAGDVVGQLPGGHLAAEVGVLGDQGGGGIAATEDDGGWVVRVHTGLLDLCCSVQYETTTFIGSGFFFIN